MAVARRALTLAVTAVAAHAGVAGAATGYRFLTVDRPGASSTYLTTVADDGSAVGAFTDPAGRTHGLLRSATGHLSTVDVPGAKDTYALGRNASGAISGTYADVQGHQHGFVLQHGRVRRVDIPGAAFTDVFTEFGQGLGTSVATIAADGTLTGTYADAMGAAHGFVLHPGGRPQRIDVPGASTAADPAFHLVGGTIAIRSDAAGTVVGAYAPAKRTITTPLDLRGYVRTGGRFRDLLPPGSETSQAFGFDAHGTVTGVGFAPGGVKGTAFLWRAGRFTSVRPAGGLLLSTVASLNAKGVVAGEIVTPDGVTHGYLGFPR